MCGPVGIDTDHRQHRVLPCNKQKGRCRTHGCCPGNRTSFEKNVLVGGGSSLRCSGALEPVGSGLPEPIRLTSPQPCLQSWHIGGLRNGLRWKYLYHRNQQTLKIGAFLFSFFKISQKANLPAPHRSDAIPTLVL